MCCSLKSEFRWGEDESHDPTSEIRPIAAGGKLRTVFVPRTPLRCSLRSSGLTAYRRWLDRAGIFTNMILLFLEDLAAICTLLLIFESRSLTCAWRNSDRTPAGGARIAQQRPNRRKFVHACFADTPYVGGRDFIFARSGQ